MIERIRIQLPDWRRWLAERVALAARDFRDYELHLAALEWTLSSALDINRREDFLTLPSPSVEPFEHQVNDAILFFRRLQPRGLIADDVGLGKTITAGLIARELLERNRIESLLVVCPKSLIPQWQEELDSKFGMKAVGAVGADFYNLSRHPFWITSYATARARIAAIRARKFDLLILDEAHALRNLYGGQTTPQVATAFEQLMRDDSVRYTLMLTATPIQNRLWDIFSLLEILRAPQPNPLGTPDVFRMRYIADQPARRLRAGTEDDFRQKVAEVTVRTRRSDTNLLFPQREVRTELLRPLPEEQQYIDDALRVILQFRKLAQITHARTLMSSPWAAAAAFEAEAAKTGTAPALRDRLLELSRRGREIATSAKIDAVLRLVRASTRDGRPGRVIVFTQRVETLRHLESALRAAGFGRYVAIVRGGESESNLRAIQDFTTNPPARPILLSMDVGAVGLNLQAGNVVVNYDLPWNPMLIEQRIGRVQRLGQKARHVVVHNLVLTGTIEDAVVRRLMEKLALFNQAIGEMEELLEICGYDEEHRSLDQVIMDLIRKAAEQKDIEEDLRRMEESRRAAEARIKEMREATEQALASIRPRDTGARLQNLERVAPRLPLPDLVKACLRRSGVDFREEEGRLLVRTQHGYTEFIFDRDARLAIGDTVRLVLPGTRAFDTVTRAVREHVAHHIVDGTGAGFSQLRRLLEDRLGAAGMVLENLSQLHRATRVAFRAALHVASEVATDRYETIIELDQASEDDGIAPLLGAIGELQNDDGRPLAQCTTSAVESLAEHVATIERPATEAVKNHSSVRRFCEFYGERYHEDLRSLLDHARSLGHRPAASSLEDAVESVARQDPSIRTALASLRLRLLPTIKIDLVGVTGIRYAEVEFQASVRNRGQERSHALRFRAVPLTGLIKSPIPGLDELPPDAEGWACPGGHIAPADRFIRCTHDACTAGACGDCAGTLAAGSVLRGCVDCHAPLCERHRLSCEGCQETFCSAHAHPLSGRSGHACSRCSAELPDGRRVLEGDLAPSAVSGRRGPITDLEPSALSGRRAFPEELVVCDESGRRVLPDETVVCRVTGKRVASDLVEWSAVSGEPALRSAMRRSAWSGRPCLPGEERVCDETGVLLLPDEIDECSLTRRRVRKDLLETDSATGRPVLRRLLARSDISSRWATPEHLTRSDISQRRGLPEELVRCTVCHRTLLSDEVVRCAETGRHACPEHFQICELSGERVLAEGLGQCAVTGRRVRRSLLAQCPDTGKVACRDLFERCELTGVPVLPEALAASAISGKRVRRTLLTTCQVTGQVALPTELAACAVSGKLVRPDLLIACPETEARFLPDHGVLCEETGALVIPQALGTCSVTGRRARKSLLSLDDITGQPVLTRLLTTCTLSGTRTVMERLAVSSISGLPALPSHMARCEVTGRPALPKELGTCQLTGKAVHPDLLVTCPETGIRMLADAGERCEATGDLIAPRGLGLCQATGKRVRRSLLAADEVTGQTVMASLLRSCERTGRRTLPANLLTSAATGIQVLSGIVQHCEETGAPALPEELARCQLSGKRVLPSLLAPCDVSGMMVLRSHLRACDITGKHVLPQYLTRCRRSGKTILTSLTGKSDVSGEVGLKDLLVTCEASGRVAFPDELVNSQLSGKRVARDRVSQCRICGRLVDLAELVRCPICHQFYCQTDCAPDACRSCAQILTETSGRSLTDRELRLLRETRPWVRRGSILDSRGIAHVHVRTSRLRLRRRSALLVFDKPKADSPGVVLRNPVAERAVTPTMMATAQVALSALSIK